MAPRETLSVAQVAEILSCHRQTAYYLITDGRLPAFRIGRAIRVAKVDLLAFRDRNKYRKRKPRKKPVAKS